MLYDGDAVSAADAPDFPMSRNIVELEADDANEAAGAASNWQGVHLCERLGSGLVGGGDRLLRHAWTLDILNVAFCNVRAQKSAEKIDARRVYYY